MTGSVPQRWIGRWLATVPRATWLLVVVALVGVGAVETGVRAVSAFDPAAGSAAVPTPAFAAGIVEALRAAPFDHVEDRSQAAIVSGIVFGRTDEIDAADRQRFLDSGLWHLLAASGQNVALVVGMCLVAAWLSGGGRALGIVWALLAVPLYVMTVGGGPSIVRAGIMAELALVAWLVGRLRDTVHALVAAGALLVWVFPGVHRTLGFQLSFACVAGLAVICGPLARWLRGRGVPAGIATAVAATITCSLVTAPLLLARTGSAPAVAAAANLVAVPIAAFVLVAGLAAAIIGLAAPQVASPLFALTGMAAHMLQATAAHAARMPGAQVESWRALLGVAAVIAAGLIAARTHGRRRVAMSAACLAVALVLVVLPTPGSLDQPGEGVVRIAVLDVGQGDAVLVQHGSSAILVDTGPADGKVVARLDAAGVDDLVGVVLTHGSADHVDGLPSVVRSRHVGWIAQTAVNPPGHDDSRVEVGDAKKLCAGDSMALDEVDVRVLHPYCDGRIVSATGDTANDNAVVLLVTYGSVRALLTSDTEGPVLLRMRPPDIDILKLSHHGSADTGLEALLDMTTPSVALVSVGADNDYGHPAPSTVRALRAARVPLGRTDRDGTVAVETDGTRVWLAG